MEKYYIGHCFKFSITITSQGFDMDRDNWNVKIVNGHKYIEYSRGNKAVVDSNGQYYIPVATNDLGVGTYRLIVEFDVPDDDFEDGFRHEVIYPEKPLCNVARINYNGYI